MATPPDSPSPFSICRGSSLELSSTWGRSTYVPRLKGVWGVLFWALVPPPMNIHSAGFFAPAGCRIRIGAPNDKRNLPSLFRDLPARNYAFDKPKGAVA